ncbi:MAG: ABC transporter substrate-binding protein [Treponema sp.]|nr:ABC transporter substrate-binding protein [Treponema sp.]
MKKTICGLIVLAATMMVALAGGKKEVTDNYSYTVASPSGAPGVAVAMLAVENQESYTFLAAETITAEFSKAQSDFVIAPINAGAKLYAMGKSTYKLGAVVTWGNLYFASQKEGFSLDDINGAVITLFGEKTINASIARFVLEKNGIVPADIAYLGSAANTQNLLLTDPTAIVLTAEPALSAAQMKNKGITAYSVNDLYKKATGFDGFTQAGLFVREKTITEHPAVVAQFLHDVSDSIEKCSSDTEAVADAVVALEILPNKKVALSAIPRCSIAFMSAKKAKKQVEKTALIDVEQYGGVVPAADFYYDGQR